MLGLGKRPRLRRETINLRRLLAYILGKRNLCLVPPLPCGTERAIFDQLDIGEVSVVFDVGAFQGDMADRFARSFPEAEVYCFEPVPSTFNKLYDRMARYPRMHLYSFAIASETGLQGITIAEGKQSNRLIARGSHPEGWPTQEVNVVSMADFVYEQKIEKIDIVKIDTEGYELDVLKGAGEFIENIRCVLAEVTMTPEMSHHTAFRDFDVFMCAKGYELRGVYGSTYDRNGMMSFTNVLYCRS